MKNPTGIKFNTKNILIVTGILLILALIYYYPLIYRPLSVPGGYDMVSYYYPYWNYIQARYNEEGEMPLWNSSIMSGTTIIGNAHFSLFYPVNWLFLVLPVELVFNIWFAFHIFLAGIGTYLFLKRLKIDLLPSLFGSIIFMCGGHLAVRMNIGHYHLLSAVAWIPLVFLFFLKMLDERNIRSGLLLGLFLGFQLLTLHIQIFYLTGFALFIFFLIFCFLKLKRREVTYSQIIKVIIMCTGAFILAVLLCSAQLLPVIEATLSSHRSDYSYTEFANLSLPPLQVLGIFLPDLWGYDNNYFGARNYWEISSFAGFITLIPFLFSFKKRNIYLRTFQYSAFFVLLIALGKYTPVGKLTYYLPFMFMSRIPARILNLLVFFIAVISAFGFQWILDEFKKDKAGILKRLCIMSSILLAITVLVTLIYIGFPNLLKQLFYPDSDLKSRILDNFIRSVLFHMGIISLVVFIASIINKFKLRASFITILILIILFGELFLYNSRLLKPRDRNNLIKGYEQFAIIKGRPGDKFRIFGGEYRYQLGFELYRLDRADGYEALMNRFMFEVLHRKIDGTDTRAGSLTAYSLKISRILNSRFILTNRDENIEEDGFKRIATAMIRGKRTKIFRSFKSLPRAYFTDSVVTDKTIQDFYRFVDGDKYMTSIFADLEYPDRSDTIFKKVDIKEYKSNLIKIKISSDRRGIVVLSDAYFPGWHVMVDGKENEILRVNWALKGVMIGEGDHIIEFIYKPRMLRIGYVISLSGLLILISGFIFIYIKKKKSSEVP